MTDETAPVTFIPGDEDKAPERGIAICLSGGGYRAMLFHLGSIWRMLELGLLDPVDRSATNSKGTTAVGQLQRISSVSGGSLTSALLGLKWSQIAPGTAGALDRYRGSVVAPIRAMAKVTLAGADVAGALNVIAAVLAPGSVHDHVTSAYKNQLYGDATLQALPEEPRFVINATNLQSGALWRFSRKYMADWRVGIIENTDLVSIAKAVAASSAFPPILAPATFAFKTSDYKTPGKGETFDLQRPPYTTEPLLADGGVYDNLGLETAYKNHLTLLVSNAGKPFPEPAEVHRDWVRLGLRVTGVVDNQVGALRKRLLIEAYKRGERTGAFWDIDQNIQKYACADHLQCDVKRTQELADIPTDLSEKSDDIQERLINWGYALADASLRTHFDTTLPAPGPFPYPNGV